MNALTEKTQETLPTQLAKEGLKISETPLKKLLTARAALVKSLYAAPMSEAAFNRARAEEEMIKAVASYNVSVEALLEAQTAENQGLREALAAKDREIAALKAELLEWVQAYRLKSEGEAQLVDKMLTVLAA